MTSTLRHISFRHLGTTEVHQRFLEGDRDLGGFLGLRARSVEELLKRAPTGAERVIPREELVASLTAYADRYGAPPQVYANIEALLDPENARRRHRAATGVAWGAALLPAQGRDGDPTL